MLTFLKMIMILMSNYFIFTYSPLMKIFILTMNILFLSLIFSFLNKTSWFILMFILLMIGGLMILFIYFTSLCKEKKLSFEKTKMTMMVFLLLLISKSKMNFNLSMNSENKFLNFLYSLNFSMFILLLIFYMLILLIFNLELISNMKCSFRSMN